MRENRSARARPALFLCAAALATAAPASATTLAAGSFERSRGGWEATPGARVGVVAGLAHGGTRALGVTLRRPRDGGAQRPVTFETLLRTGLSGSVTKTVQGSFTVTAWVRAGTGTLGRPVRLQLNETGGANVDEILGGTALADARLGRSWRRLTARGTVRGTDRVGLLALAVLPGGRRGDAFFVDDFRLTGEPLEAAPGTTTSERWPLWVFGVVWLLVLAAGALALWWAGRDRDRIRTGEANVFASVRPPRRSTRRGRPT